MDILAESAVRIAVIALGVAVVLRALRIRSPRLVHDAWVAVVVVMLLLPVVLAWGPEFAVPLLPSQAASTLLSPGTRDGASAEPDETPVIALAADRTLSRMTWTSAGVAMYVAGVAFFLLRLATGLRRARAIRRRVVLMQGRVVHPACVTPITVGVVAPAVILPVDWPTWDERELSAVLAHEEEHVRRRDPLVGVLALLNRAIFWFHPLAWWLQREIARLSEQACDTVVVSRGHDCDMYSACLLRFARRAADAGGRLAPMATAMPGSGLQYRLRMLAHPQLPRPSGARLACAAAACAALCVVSAAAVPVAAPAQAVTPRTADQAAWSVRTSEHFEIFHNGLSDDRVSQAVRDAEDAYTQLSGALKHEMPGPVLIILVSGDRDLPGTPAQAIDLVRRSGAPPGERVVISLESLDRRTGILVHELSHQFAFEIIPRVSRVAPVLIEGLAEYHRGVWGAEDLRMTRDAVAAGAIPSVVNLDAPDRHWAHAVFDFVAAQRGEEGVRRLLFELRAHDTLVPAVPMAFGVTLEQFDREFRDYVTTRFRMP